MLGNLIKKIAKWCFQAHLLCVLKSRFSVPVFSIIFKKFNISISIVILTYLLSLDTLHFSIPNYSCYKSDLTKRTYFLFNMNTSNFICYYHKFYKIFRGSSGLIEFAPMRRFIFKPKAILTSLFSRKANINTYSHT